MSLHAISVFDNVSNEALKNVHFKNIIRCFEEVKKDKWPDLPNYHHNHFPP